jgi:hypothetical protein
MEASGSRYFLWSTFIIYVKSKKQIINVTVFSNDIPEKVQKDISQTYKIQYSKGTKIPHIFVLLFLI